MPTSEPSAETHVVGLSGLAPWRAVLAVPCLLFVLGGPIAAHLFGTRTVYTPGWFMFATGGTRICLVEYHRRTPAGDIRIDRLETLGVGPWYRAKARHRRLSDMDAVTAQGRLLCEILGPGTDLRVDAKCGDPHGWIPTASREVSLCLAE